MKRTLFAIVALAAIGCEGFLRPKLVDSDGRLVTRTYEMTGCQSTFDASAAKPVPCTSYVSGTSRWVADSGRLILRGDGSAQWMLGTTRTTCFLSGQSCSSPGAGTTTTGVDASAATYRIAGDSLLVHLQQTGSSGTDLVFHGIPDRVPTRWEGPDLLTFNLSNGAYLGIFKP